MDLSVDEWLAKGKQRRTDSSVRCCADCKHLYRYKIEGSTNYMCDRPSMPIHIVRGVNALLCCENERRGACHTLASPYVACGPEGKYWEPKDV